ncbi:MAG TPA: hypothetical protein VH186_13875 [Chloroflexia bacterium]|nr:hypothetical protein [Chloroflexia bacterium]
MADINEINLNKEPREYDELDRVLSVRPMLKAPRHTSARVMALIANVPQLETSAAFKMVAQGDPAVVKYAAPAALPLPAEEAFEPFEASETVERRQRRYLFGIIFTGAWSGLCLLVLWLIWPAISYLLFGPSSDPEMQVRLDVLTSLWTGFVGFFSDFIATYGWLLPSLVSGAVGLSLMAAFLFNYSPRRTMRA